MATKKVTDIGTAQMAKARAALAEKRKKGEPIGKGRVVLEAARELAHLYKVRDDVNAKILAIETRLAGGHVTVAKGRRSGGYMKPTLDILALIKDGETVDLDEVDVRNVDKYGERYSRAAVSSSLRRLSKPGGPLTKHGRDYTRR